MTHAADAPAARRADRLRPGRRALRRGAAAGGRARARSQLTVVGAEDDDAYNRVLRRRVRRRAAPTRERLEVDRHGRGARRRASRIRLGEAVVAIDRDAAARACSTPARRLPYDRLVLRDRCAREHPDARRPGALAPRPSRGRRRRAGARPGRATRCPPASSRCATCATPTPSAPVVARRADDRRARRRRARHGVRARRRRARRRGRASCTTATSRWRATSTSTAAGCSPAPPARAGVGHGRALPRRERPAPLTTTTAAGASTALLCADGKQIPGDLLVLSCGVGARTELARRVRARRARPASSSTRSCAAGATPTSSRSATARRSPRPTRRMRPAGCPAPRAASSGRAGGRPTALAARARAPRRTGELRARLRSA